MIEPIYCDGRYTVTRGSISTPSRFYPVANTTAMVRRDPLWSGLVLAIFSAGALLVYGDLLYGGEKLACLAIAATALILGAEVRVLRIHALGHPSATIVGRRTTIGRLYRAIRTAHDTSTATGMKPYPLENSSKPEQ